MPRNISLLNNLCTLTTFIVDTKAGHGIEELKDLQHLGNRLELYDLRKIKSGPNAKEANLHEKQNVGELLMCWGHGRDDMPEDEACNAEQLLESLAPHSKLKILEACIPQGSRYQCLQRPEKRWLIGWIALLPLSD